MMANEKGEEVESGLLCGQTPKDRPDLGNRVFWIKLQQLLNDIEKGQIFGETVATLWVVEFQKLGKPHAHILVTLKDNDKLKTGADIDTCISAERPNTNNTLLALVDQFMLHSNIHIFTEL